MPRMRRGRVWQPEELNPGEDSSWLYQTLGQGPPTPPAAPARPRGRGDPALRHGRVRAGGRFVPDAQPEPAHWCPWCGLMRTGPEAGRTFHISPRGASDRYCETATGGRTESCVVAFEKAWHRDLDVNMLERANAPSDRIPPRIVSPVQARREELGLGPESTPEEDTPE